MRIESEAIGYERAPRPHAEDDFWGGEQARATLATTSSGRRWASSLSAARTGRIASALRFARWFASKDARWSCRNWTIDGAPILDIKPVMGEFLPRSAVRQPAWSHELMREYWLQK